MLTRISAHPPGQRHGQLDGEHHLGPRHRHPPASRRLIGIPPRLPDRNREPARQHPRRLRRPHSSLRQVRSGVDALGVLPCRRPATTHDMKILPDLSPIAGGTPGLLQPAVTQRHIETEIAKCVGGVLSPLIFNIALGALDEQLTAPWKPGGAMSTEARRAARRRKGLPTWKAVRYADLCRGRHKSAYAEARVMPILVPDAPVRAVGDFLLSA